MTEDNNKFYIGDRVRIKKNTDKRITDAEAIVVEVEHGSSYNVHILGWCTAYRYDYEDLELVEKNIASRSAKPKFGVNCSCGFCSVYCYDEAKVIPADFDVCAACGHPWSEDQNRCQWCGNGNSCKGPNTLQVNCHECGKENEVRDS